MKTFAQLYTESQAEGDCIHLNVPLFIRLLEWAREDAKTDMDLHKVAEKAISLSKDETLTMDHYETLLK
jgi:hypothetical protein